MKKALITLLATALIAGSATMASAKKVEDLNLEISGLGQIGYTISQSNCTATACGADMNNQLDINRLRIKLAAQPADKVKFNAALEGTDNQNFGANQTGLFPAADSRVVDMFVTMSYLDWVTIKVGQMPSPVSYELNTDEYALETIDYSQIVGSMVNRDRGAGFIIPVTDAVSLVTWALNGEGTIGGASNAIDDSAFYGGMLNVKPIDNLSFKIWGNFGGYTSDGATFTGLGLAGFTAGLKSEVDVDALGAGVDYKYQGFHLFSEYGEAKMKAKDTTGNLGTASKRKDWYVNASYVIPETGVQLVGRYDQYDPDNTATNDRNKITTLGLNWDFEKDARLQAMYEIVKNEAAAAGTKDDNLAVQLSVRF